MDHAYSLLTTIVVHDISDIEGANYSGILIAINSCSLPPFVLCCNAIRKAAKLNYFLLSVKLYAIQDMTVVGFLNICTHLALTLGHIWYHYFLLLIYISICFTCMHSFSTAICDRILENHPYGRILHFKYLALKSSLKFQLFTQSWL